MLTFHRTWKDHQLAEEDMNGDEEEDMDSDDDVEMDFGEETSSEDK